MKLKLRKIDEDTFEDDTLTLKELTDYVWRCNNWKIVEIDGKEVINYCENCHIPLVDGDKYIVDVESCYICQECYEKLKEEV